jgi:hypothetical protein
LLWVDDKTLEGRKMWNSLKEIHKTAIMIQLMSTEELADWLKSSAKIVADLSIDMVMITNMTRVEKGAKKEEAGVEAIKAYRQFRQNGLAYVYVGWLDNALSRLQQHALPPSPTLQVSTSPHHLRTFLRSFQLK